jgi:hypothetical protein
LLAVVAPRALITESKPVTKPRFVLGPLAFALNVSSVPERCA